MLKPSGPLLLLVATAALFGEPATMAADEALEEVVVSGEQPGPGLWKVSRDGHILYVMGTLSPLPTKIQWKSSKIESVVAQSQQVISGTSVRADIGVFQGMRLIPSALRARANANGKELIDLLPAPLYERWKAAKEKYVGDNKKMERWRPMFAGGALYDASLNKSNLNGRDIVSPVIKRLAKKHNVPIREPTVMLHIEDPKGLIREFTNTPLAQDIQCFESLLQRVEGDLPLLRRRANAWATGDVDTLRSEPPTDSENTCLNALTSTPRMAKAFSEAIQKAKVEWLLAAEGALVRNQQSFAVLGVDNIVGPDSLLKELERRGCTVEAP
jgi:uncharacterized protein YbaP (TraB family)